MQTALLIIIILLSVYMIYLQIQLAKKNILIESIIRKISGIEKELSVEEIRKFITELHKFNIKTSFYEDRMFEEKTLAYILGTDKNARVYIHYTQTEEVAKAILKEGFKFADTFHKTALPVTNDRLDLMIKHNSKRFYGDYVIVISISDDIVRYYAAELDRAGITNYSFENILTERPAEKNDNAENVFLLPPQFVKGYINYKTGAIVNNAVFHPGYSSPGFTDNILRLKEKAK